MYFKSVLILCNLVVSSVFDLLFSKVWGRGEGIFVISKVEGRAGRNFEGVGKRRREFPNFEGVEWGGAEFRWSGEG